MEKTITWGIIGCGNVTEMKSGPAFNKVPGSRLHAVMRRDAALAEDYAKRHQVPVWYSDAAALINDPEINAVYIATPPKFHEEYTLAALEKGKMVYVEKPVSLNVASVERMAEACNRLGGKVVVAHYRRALPMFNEIAALVRSNRVGRIKLIKLAMFKPDDHVTAAQHASNWRVQPEFAGGGYFYDLAPHQLDIIQYIFGMPVLSAGLSANQAGFTLQKMRLSVSFSFRGTFIFRAAGISACRLSCVRIVVSLSEKMAISSFLFLAMKYVWLRMRVQVYFPSSIPAISSNQ